MNSKLLMLLAAVLLTVGATNVYAQETNKEGTVNLNVKLHQIQTLVVNQSQSIVDLEYTTKEDYFSGVSSKQQDDHLTVFSTSGFKVTAKALAANFTGVSGNTNVIPTTDISIAATAGSNNNLEGTTLPSTNLSDAEAITLISSEKGGRDLNYNVKYSAKGGDEYINKYVKGENPTVYTTTVTYTITTL